MYRLYKFYKSIHWDNLFLIPTIRIITNEPIMIKESFGIGFHFLGFHCHWLFIKKGAV